MKSLQELALKAMRRKKRKEAMMMMIITHRLILKKLLCNKIIIAEAKVCIILRLKEGLLLQLIQRKQRKV